MTRRPMVLLLALGLLLAGIDIPLPAEGTVVTRERIGGVQVRRVNPADCDFWNCRSTLVEWRLPRYVVVYRWELAGGLISGSTRCPVPPGRYWQAQRGEAFTCKSEPGA